MRPGRLRSELGKAARRRLREVPDPVAGLPPHVGGGPKQAIGEIRKRVQGGGATVKRPLCVLHGQIHHEMG